MTNNVAYSEAGWSVAVNAESHSERARADAGHTANRFVALAVHKHLLPVAPLCLLCTSIGKYIYTYMSTRLSKSINHERLCLANEPVCNTTYTQMNGCVWRRGLQNTTLKEKIHGHTHAKIHIMVSSSSFSISSVAILSQYYVA